MKVWEALFEPLVGEVSVKDAAHMLRQGSKDFKKAADALKQAVRGSRECLSREFEKLRTRKPQVVRTETAAAGTA